MAKKKPAPPGLNWPGMKIDMVPINDLVPYARNARLHSPAQVAQIRASMREYGWTMPVLRDERNGIIAGHGRVLAGLEEGFAAVPCITATGWSEAKKRAYVLADNKLSLNASWDEELLRAELADLQAADYDLSLTGFDDDELARLMEDPETEFPDLADGDGEPFQEMTFVLHDTQVDIVNAALAKAKKKSGPETDGPNENSNGNALAEICAAYLAAGKRKSAVGEADHKSGRGRADKAPPL